MKQLPENVWKFTGSNSGSSVIVLGGIHGNELTGIEVVKKLRERFKAGEIKLERGTLFLALGNLHAIKENKRASRIECDLNRQFSKSNLENPPQNFYESGRAQELASVLREADICLDLHATNKPSKPFVCLPTITDEKLEIIKHFKVDRVLVDPWHILAGCPVSTDEFMEELGKIGICYETGFAGDTSRIDDVLGNIIDILRDKEMISGGRPDTPANEVEVYEFVEAIRLTDKGWRFADGFGNENFEKFENGQAVGCSGDEEIRPDFNGVVVFPKIREHWSKGSPVCYLAQRKY